jgi:hypothetical protein
MATNTLALGTAKKSTGSKVRVPCDFGNLRPLIDGYTISSYTITISGTGAPTKSGEQVDYTAPNGADFQISALFDGGDVGSYEIVYTIVLNDPDSLEYEAVGTIIVE